MQLSKLWGLAGQTFSGHCDHCLSFMRWFPCGLWRSLPIHPLRYPSSQHCFRQENHWMVSFWGRDGKGRLTFRFNVQSSDWMSFQSFQEDGAASHWPEPWCVGHLVIKIIASSFMTIGVRLQQNDLPLKCRKFPAWLFWSCMIWARWGCLPSNPTWMGCHGIQSTPVAQERTQPKAPCLNGGQATDTQYLFGSVLKACMLKHCADPCCIALLNPRCCSTQRYYNAEAALLESREPEPEACWHS